MSEIEGSTANTVHSDYCEAEGGHHVNGQDCATATRLARLVAFVETVRDTFDCTEGSLLIGEASPDHVDDCFHCYALQALEPVR